MMLSVSVVIPVLNAARYLPSLLPALLAQNPVPPHEIILVDTNSTDDTRKIADEYPAVTVIPIDKFSHGRSRNMGAHAASGNIVVIMSQDAEPVDDAWLANLVEPFSDERVAAAYSRQIPRPAASPMECFFMKTHFPADQAERRERHGDEHLTLQTVFFSNVSAAVRRDILLEYPFDESLIMSEDQQLSRDLINAGYAVVYVPKSIVVHSHDYTLKTVFQRYFDSIYSLTVIFPKHDMGTSASMGLSYLWREFLYVSKHSMTKLPYYMLYTLAKTGGTVAGHFAEHMPRSLLRKISLHAYHWE